MVDIVTRLGKGSPLTNAEVDANFTNLAEVSGVTGEPMGHEDRTTSTISFNASTRTFTIAPTASSFTVWCKGKKVVVSSARTVTIPNTTGMYSIYFDSTGTLAAKSGYFTFAEEAPTAYIYWNATTGTAPYFGDERHGVVLDWQTHEYLHRTRGAALASGFSASGYVLGGSGSLNSHAQLTLEGGTFFDEDMKIIVTATNTPTAGTWEQDLTSPARIPVLYLSGTAWVIDSPTDYPLKQGTARPQYNAFSGGVWSTADVANNKYATSWILATNNLTYPVIAIIGQAESDLQSAAEAVDFTALQLPGFPSVEFRPLYKLIFQCADSCTNAVHASLVSITDIRSIAAAGTAASIVTDHGNLSGLSDDDHPQYLSVDTVRGSLSAAVKASFLPSQTSNTGKFLQTDGTATSWQALTSGNVTTALGFTPYNATNPSGFITGITSGNVTTALGFTPYNATNPSGYVTAAGARGSISVTGAGSYDSATGVINIVGGVTSFNTRTGAITLSSSDVTTALGFTPYNSTNPNGYLTGITSTQVTTALGFTPYNSSNPSGYITGITSGMVTTALGFTPYNNSNPSGYITSSALSPYLTTASAASTYAPLTGTGASGTWGISISGNSATVTNGLYKVGTNAIPAYVSLNTTADNWMWLWQASSGNDWYLGPTTANFGLGGSRLAISSSGSSPNAELSIERGTTRLLEILQANLQYKGNVVLHAGNYTSFSLPVTGGTFTGNVTLDTGNGEIVVSPTGWRSSDRAAIKIRSKANTPAEIDLRHTVGGVESGWHISARDTSSASELHFYRFNMNSAGAADAAGSFLQMFTFRADGSFNTAGAITQSGSQVLTAGNYNSYALPISGGTVTGTLRLGDSSTGLYLSGGRLNIRSESTDNVAEYASYGLYLPKAGQAAGLYVESPIEARGGLRLGSGAVNGTITVGADTAATANRLVQRDGNGHITGNYILGSYFNSSAGNSENPTIGQVWTQSTGDNYLRKSTPAHFISQLGLLTTGNYSSYALPLSGGTISGPTYISTGGNYPLQLISTQRYMLQIRNSNNSVNSGYGWWFATDTNFNFAMHADGLGDVLTLTRSGALTLNGNTVLHAGNYSSYSPTLTGGGASGTWGINVTGTATSANKTNANSGYARVGYGMAPFYNWGGANAGSGAPSDSTYTTGIDVGSHPSDQAYGFQIASNMWNVGLWTRTYNSGFSGWVRILDSSNYNSYSPTLTGGNASGTWGISVTGNAATAGGLAVHDTQGTQNSANQIVRTQVNGYTMLGWINTTSGDSGIENRLTRIYSSNDGYVRYSTLTDFKVHMGLSAKNSYSRRIDYTSDANYHVGSMGHSGYGANETFHGGSGFIDIWSGTNYPPSTSHIHGFNALHYTTNSLGSTGGNAYGIQVVGQYDQGGLLFSRGCNGGSFSAWRRQLDDNNYNSYAPTLTGGNASGTWGINISGASDRTYRGIIEDTRAGQRSPNAYDDYRAHFEFTDQIVGDWHTAFTMQGWHDGYSAWQIIGPASTSAHENWYLRSGVNTSWNSVRTILHSGNYSSYSPPYSGGTLSGTWYFNTSAGSTSGALASPALQAYSTGNNAAWFSWHKAGHYAVNMGLDSDNVLRIGGWSASANRWQLDMSGNMTVAGNVTAYSDERLKKDWAPVRSGFVEALASIKSGTYTRIDSEERQAGVSAQDFQNLLPEAVSEDNEGTLSLAYGNAALVSAVELAKDNVELRARIERLESLINKLIGD